MLEPRPVSSFLESGRKEAEDAEGIIPVVAGLKLARGRLLVKEGDGREKEDETEEHVEVEDRVGESFEEEDEIRPEGITNCEGSSDLIMILECNCNLDDSKECVGKGSSGEVR